jgi:tetratricopeptide (TPR) repeat protein
MLRLQHAQSPSQWRANHITLAEANAAWARDTAGQDGGSWRNARWVDHTREQTYHLLCADPASNLPQALATAVKAAEHSTTRARQWAQLITDAGRDTGDPALQRWGQRLLDGIHDNDLTQYLTSLINHAQLENTTLVIALEQRGETHRLADHYNEALADFNRAIELDPSEANYAAKRAEILRLQGSSEGEGSC